MKQINYQIYNTILVHNFHDILLIKKNSAKDHSKNTIKLVNICSVK